MLAALKQGSAVLGPALAAQQFSPQLWRGHTRLLRPCGCSGLQQARLLHDMQTSGALAGHQGGGATSASAAAAEMQCAVQGAGSADALHEAAETVSASSSVDAPMVGTQLNSSLSTLTFQQAQRVRRLLRLREASHEKGRRYASTKHLPYIETRCFSNQPKQLCMEM